MVERMKDEQDRMLESLFASAPIEDDGFSARVLGRIRRRIWLRRLALPVAAVVGALVSFKPLAGLLKGLAGLSAVIPLDQLNVPVASVPQLQTVILGAVLLATCLIGMRVIED